MRPKLSIIPLLFLPSVWSMGKMALHLLYKHKIGYYNKIKEKKCCKSQLLLRFIVSLERKGFPKKESDRINTQDALLITSNCFLTEVTLTYVVFTERVKYNVTKV